MAESDFARHLRENSEGLEHQANLRGKTKTKCTKCKDGMETEGHSDRDSHGAYWVSGTTCRYCGGFPHSVEKECSAAVELAAVDKEIKKYRERRKMLVKKTKVKNG